MSFHLFFLIKGVHHVVVSVLGTLIPRGRLLRNTVLYSNEVITSLMMNYTGVSVSTKSRASLTCLLRPRRRCRQVPGTYPSW
jgi:hypothetical protein